MKTINITTLSMQVSTIPALIGSISLATGFQIYIFLSFFLSNIA